MTKEEAIRKMDTKFWVGMSPRQIVEFQLFEERLCVPFGVFHEAVEKVLGRPVWTHEFANVEALRTEFRGTCKAPSFQEIVDKFPKDKPVLVVKV